MTERYSKAGKQSGFAMIEILVTIVIVAIGLLGLAGLQARLQVAEIESYQRAQALLLLNDMSSRLSTNRRNAGSYATGVGATPLVEWGTGMTCPAVTSTSTQAAKDLSEWCNAIQGAGESASGSRVGAMTGGRGCIETLAANLYLITVAWQGFAAISAPPASVDCGLGDYNNSGACTGELCRRAVTTVVEISPLQ